MKIVFYPINCSPFHGLTLYTKPLGGTETAIIHLAEALYQLGHEVIVLTDIIDPPPTQPLYTSTKELKDIKEITVVIFVRGWTGAMMSVETRTKFLWTGDSYKNLHTIGLGDKRVVTGLDALLGVTDWQLKTLCIASGFPIDKSHVLPNGINLSDFNGSEKRVRRRLIYSSNPQRGLIYMPLVFLKLKQKYPDLEFHIFSNSALFDLEWPPKVSMDLPHEAVLNLFRGIPGCHIHGTILQQQLAREYMKSSILAYPCNVEETSCISVLEAQAGGCPVVTTAIGGLEETVGDGGILIREKPGTDVYLEKFTEALDLLLSDDAKWEELSKNGIKRMVDYDWKKIAADLITYFKIKQKLI